MSKIRIGWAEESLVPEKKIALAGQFYERISKYVESPITATAMAVEADGDCMILVSADIGQAKDFLLDAVRTRFEKLTDEVPSDKLILCATHTHTSHTLAPEATEKNTITATSDLLEKYSGGRITYQPAVTAGDDVMRADESTAFVSDRIAKAAYAAWQNRAPAYYTNEFGRAAVGMCRRVTYDDGSAQMWGDVNTANFVSMEGGNDSGIELLFVFDGNKKLTGIVANIACPAQILEQRSFISADYWGKVKSLLRGRFGEELFLLPMIGAAGDQCPRDLVRWVQPETPIDDPNIHRPHPIHHKADPSMYDISGRDRVGRRIAAEIFAVYDEITELKDEAVFRHEVLNLLLPLRKVTMTQYREAEREIMRFVELNRDKPSFDFGDLAQMHVHAGTIGRYNDQQFRETVPAECHVVRFADFAIATVPFELYLDYGNRVKARSYAEQTFIGELTCGNLGYLPTEKAERAGHYSAYVSSGNVGHEGGDILTRELITHINGLWK